MNLLYIGVCDALGRQIEKLLVQGSTFIQCDDVPAALRHIGSDGQDTEIVVMSDLAQIDLLEALLELKKNYHSLPVIVLSENRKSSLAIEIIKAGADDFFLLPISSTELIDSIQQSVVDARLSSTPVEIGEVYSDQDTIIGKSRAMRDIYKQLGRIASQTVTVLVRGETGTGKELIARAIYQHGHRAHKGFIAVNCAAIPETLLESELFGHEKGSFTGANQLRVGRFEQAHGGTLFLDEIGDMPLDAQTRLLRVLQEGEYTSVGGKERIKVDVRIITATNKDLKKLIDLGVFREDLYYRLNVVPIETPPLRDRIEDIPELIDYFLKICSRELGIANTKLSKEGYNYLQSRKWPGNVRELKNVIEKILILSPKDRNESLNLDFMNFEQEKDEEGFEALVQKKMLSLSLKKAREFFEREYIKIQMKRFNNNVSRTANFIGMERSALHRKLKTLKLN